MLCRLKRRLLIMNTTSYLEQNSQLMNSKPQHHINKKDFDNHCLEIKNALLV